MFDPRITSTCRVNETLDSVPILASPIPHSNPRNLKKNLVNGAVADVRRFEARTRMSGGEVGR